MAVEAEEEDVEMVAEDEVVMEAEAEEDVVIMEEVEAGAEEAAINL